MYIQDGYGHGCGPGRVTGYTQDRYGHGCNLGGVSGNILDAYMDAVLASGYIRDGYGHGCGGIGPHIHLIEKKID